MTYPVRMRQQHGNRTRLLLTCGSAALALALTLAPQRAAAQGVNAAGTVTDGAAFIDNTAPGQTTVDVITPTTVIDWQQLEDAGGNALTFLPANNTLRFQSGQLPDFAVLNRILPSTNNNIAVIDGNVISRITGPTGLAQAGGFVAFYSPTGLLIGSTATFDVGSLLLTTLDTSPASFANFAAGGNLSLAAATGSTARVQINAGAQITALAENSFFAVVAADVEMLGTARINGSHAYVAGEVVNLSLSNGLFDISIPVGTAASGEVVTINGNVGGPSSTGAGDNHILYAVARASADPISMLFSGNLGFDPAQSAGIVNGEIILAANYNVFGRNVDSSSISDGINAIFRGQSATSDVRADVILDTFNAGSSVLAIGTGETIARGESRVAGDLLLVGRIGALIDSNSVDNFLIDGDVLVDARDYGVVSSSLQSLDAINATGGNARIVSRDGSQLRIGGNVLVTAEAFGGADDLNAVAGSALGGMAEISANGGTVAITGLTSVRASAFGTNLDFIRTGAIARGGMARVTVSEGGSTTFDQDLMITADGSGAASDTFSPSTVSDSFGGTALLAITGTGTIGVGGDATLSAGATARGANASGGGALADAGEAAVSVNGSGTITIGGGLNLAALAFGGDNGGGQGGRALGGAARAVTRNGDGVITVAGDFFAIAQAQGGNGTSGGDGFGGIVGANAITGTIALQQLADADAAAFGGSATFGFSGDGGIGRAGNAFFQADGTANQAALLMIGGSVAVRATGTGGDAGMTGEAGVPLGRGGDGFGGDAGIPNQADPNFNSGAYLLAGGDYGTLSVGASAIVDASGFGGSGGNGFSSLTGGRGGNGVGGLAQVGLALLGGPGTVGGGLATFGSLFVDANGFGGGGGIDVLNQQVVGLGGNGDGGAALVTVRAGNVDAGPVQLSATGAGGTGNDGGMGTGGTAAVFGGQDGSILATAIDLFAFGFGGFSSGGNGGVGLGGLAAIEGDGITVAVNNNVTADASGSGGPGGNGAGGNGTGGDAYIGIITDTPGTITITGHARVLSNGQGGDSQTNFAAGDGQGGLAYIQSQGSSTITLGSAQAIAFGQGGTAALHEGGNGRGGTAELRSFGTGSQLIIQRNVPGDFGEAPGDGALLNADGYGANTNGGDGVGGSGRGGEVGLFARAGGSIALPTDPLADPNSIGAIQLSTRGIGGGSSTEGGTGGFGRGGGATIEADGGTIIMGQTSFAVFAQGGTSTGSSINVSGGDAFGGNRFIRVLNGGEATLAMVGGASGTRGGDGAGTGNGGDVFDGITRVELTGGTLNVVGVLDLNDQNRGGDGVIGGNAIGNNEGGGIRFVATDSVINVTADANGLAGIAMGGTFRGGDGTAAGGNAFAQPVTFTLTNTDILGGYLRINPLAQGGGVLGLSGQGGNATGSSAAVTITDSMLNLVDDNLITANAEGGAGGAGPGGIGGSAMSGGATLTLDNSTIMIAPMVTADARLTVQSLAVAGSGAQVGNATSSVARLALVDSTLQTRQLTVEGASSAATIMSGARGGTAISSLAEVTVEGASQLNVTGFLTVGSNAVTSAGGAAEGGLSTFTVANGSQAVINVGELSLIADGTGSDDPLGNVAGQFVLDVLSGNLTAGNVFASARGDTASDIFGASRLAAQSGSINVTGNLFAEVLGNLSIVTGQGGIIGAPRAATTTTSVQIRSEGVIEIAGDNNAAGGLSGDVINLAAREIDILPGARVAADRVFITSINQAATAILGGTTEGTGFTLTADELSRINARELGIFVPNLNISEDPNLPDLLVRDLSLTGTGSNGFGLVQISAGSDVADGIVRFEGTLTYANAGANDRLEIDAGRIEIVTPGGIRVTDATGAPGGNLALSADDIWVADAGTITQLQGNRSFAGRDALLAAAATGSADPLGYVRAGGVSLNVRTSLLVRNTGAPFAGGGILIGAGTLSIVSSGASQSGTGPQLDVFAYGRRQTAPGTFVIGEAFFDEVNFNRVSPGSSLYLDASAFNDCVINTGTCPQQPPPPPPPSSERPPVVEVNNPTVILGPIGMIGTPPPFDRESEDDRFGIDFPELPETPLISEDPLLDDPVSSGGDTSVYGAPAPPLTGGK